MLGIFVTTDQAAASLLTLPPGTYVCVSLGSVLSADRWVMQLVSGSCSSSPYCQIALERIVLFTSPHFPVICQRAARREGASPTINCALRYPPWHEFTCLVMEITFRGRQKHVCQKPERSRNLPEAAKITGRAVVNLTHSCAAEALKDSASVGWGYRGCKGVQRRRGGMEGRRPFHCHVAES